MTAFKSSTTTFVSFAFFLRRRAKACRGTDAPIFHKSGSRRPSLQRCLHVYCLCAYVKVEIIQDLKLRIGVKLCYGGYVVLLRICSQCEFFTLHCNVNNSHIALRNVNNSHIMLPRQCESTLMPLPQLTYHTTHE